MDKMHKNRSGSRQRDAGGRFVSQNHSNSQPGGQARDQAQARSGGFRKAGGGRGRHAVQQPRDADGRFEGK